jgi:hypothetical protein
MTLRISNTLTPRQRYLLILYGVATTFAVVSTLWGWLGDCARREIDGQCGMSTAFGAAIGFVGACMILAFGHWFPVLARLAGLSRPANDVTRGRTLTTSRECPPNQPPASDILRVPLPKSPSDER